ncbi:MAG: hypothetical protein ABW170_13335 [Candidatus Thiodiazotropha sp. L084R]
MFELEIGETYYMVAYADRDFTMPMIRPLVYVGKNIVEDEKEDRFYFQDTVSYARYGIAYKTAESLKCEISSFQKSELGISLVEQHSLLGIVSEAIEKSNKLGGTSLPSGST